MNSQQAVSQIILIVIIIGVFYFLLLRPQIKRQKERTDLITSVQKGDKIMTIGGIIGTIKDVNEETIKLEVSKDVILEMSKTAVAQRIEKS